MFVQVVVGYIRHRAAHLCTDQRRNDRVEGMRRSGSRGHRIITRHVSQMRAAEQKRRDQLWRFGPEMTTKERIAWKRLYSKEGLFQFGLVTIYSMLYSVFASEAVEEPNISLKNGARDACSIRWLRVVVSGLPRESYVTGWVLFWRVGLVLVKFVSGLRVFLALNRRERATSE